MTCAACGVLLVGKDHRWFPGSIVAQLPEANVCLKCETRLNGMVIRALSEPERKPVSSESPKQEKAEAL